MFFTKVVVTALALVLLSWSPFLILIFSLIFIASMAGYYGRSDGRMPNP